MISINQKNPGLAAVLSFLIIGLGQIYNGQIGKGIGLMVAAGISGFLCTVIIGFVLLPIVWIYGIWEPTRLPKGLTKEVVQLLDVAAVAALLTGGAVLLPSLGRFASVNRVRASEVFCRTGLKLSSSEEQSSLAKKLAQAGIKEKPEWFLGLRFSLVGGFLVLYIPLLFMGADIFWLVLLAPILYFVPNAWLNSRIARRKSEIRLALADFTLFLSTALSAGSDIRLALREAAGGAGGALQEEVERALLESSTGKRLSDALDEVADKCDVDELRTLARVLNQALRYGSSLAEVMQAHSEQMRTARKFEIVEAANKLSVKLVVPVLLFILGPCMIVLGYPAVVGLLKALG